MPSVTPTTPAGVIATISDLIATKGERPRVAIDGAPAARPEDLAAALLATLAPRPALHVRSELFWQPASLRLESGRHEPDAWLQRWLDDGALQREVLTPFADSGTALPGLRDPATDRSLRLHPVTLAPRGVLVVTGSALLGRGLTFDLVVHLHVSPSALVRRTPIEQHWILPAIEKYEESRAPDEVADLVVRWDDARRPATLRPG